MDAYKTRFTVTNDSTTFLYVKLTVFNIRLTLLQAPLVVLFYSLAFTIDSVSTINPKSNDYLLVILLS